jgi:hypothetical protein
MTNASRNTKAPPPLPDQIIEGLRQLAGDMDRYQWRVGDYLCSIWDELNKPYTNYLGSERKAHAWLISHLATRTGLAKSTLRDREGMARFFPPHVREEYEPLTYHQFRACKAAGDKWRKYADMALESMDKYGGNPAPVEVIRHWVRDNGDETLPMWRRRLQTIEKALRKIAEDERAPENVQSFCVMVLECMEELED